MSLHVTDQHSYRHRDEYEGTSVRRSDAFLVCDVRCLNGLLLDTRPTELCVRNVRISIVQL